MLNPMVNKKSGLYEATEFQPRSSSRNCGMPLASAPKDPMIDPTQELMAKIWPAYLDYQKKTDRLIPVVILERSK